MVLEHDARSILLPIAKSFRLDHIKTISVIKDKELHYDQRSKEYMPLSCVQIYSAEDGPMLLNTFVYREEENQLTKTDMTTTGEIGKM